MKLTGNKILITGGSRGIGLAMAERFLQMGNQVIITGRNAFALNSLAKRLPALEVYLCDLTKTDDIQALIRHIQHQHSDLNILINNAGVQFNYHIPEQPNVTHWVYEEMETNLIAPILLTNGLLPVLERNPNCAIVNVTSALAFVPKQSAPIYAVTKSGLHTYTQVLRYQLEDRMKVFELIPSLVDTAMTEDNEGMKISPETLVDEFMRGLKKDTYEINIGKVKLLRLLHRLAPTVALRMMRFK
ncbi:SDR family oxidoreductase [Reichenbachiella agariperforans]|uniref:SDR family oxidoreductase n=1 Tax=Reichenbachiella agariperforans TaxID=156994 RepID=UPI001C088496|nr:SDR family NAD(P)-dependent oxidoreductase [Reichenbachiella agariperforans]MBU2915427.1 SDR family NAD(P)-dependent oxidoreductase [Reichenbachiella agariperforans]